MTDNTKAILIVLGKMLSYIGISLVVIGLFKMFGGWAFIGAGSFGLIYFLWCIFWEIVEEEKTMIKWRRDIEQARRNDE